ncbi:DeoR/GlpR family DNA-binding transcription regulator [Enterococcus gilvus]|uniref:DeoR/GlpR family DNA-binding transcription regulator n=1 Tax=Enterococcus gilvus TaxID=160453 RepID=UPI001C8CBCCC|nr:DeoR/GlpR family DNA-binding transcription regulator [Enterococcus gilvus]MBX8935301.1 DeoR/GlpR transcriptional regulator [Enterococcus gilvus]
MTNFREKQILEILSKKKYLTLTQLSKLLYVSESTVRRDVSALEKKGMVRRTKGGVSLLRLEETEASREFKIMEHSEEKKRIAQLAIDFIGNNQMIFLDSSTTSYYLALEILKMEELVDLRVITTNLSGGIRLSSNENIDVSLPGGKIYKKGESILGIETYDYLSKYYFDVAFMSCRGISDSFGFSEFTHGESLIKEVVAKNSNQTVMLVDQSKFDHSFPYRSLQFDQIDFVVTDSPVSDKYKLSFADSKIEVLSPLE